MIKNDKTGQILFTGFTVNDLLQWIGQVIDSKTGILPSQTKQKQSDFITRAEASKLLKITLPTLHDWTKNGYLTAYKLGTKVLYKESEIIQQVEKASTYKHKKGAFNHA